jgi:hypothetical protein
MTFGMFELPTGRAQVNALSEDTSIFNRSRLGGHYLAYWSILQDLVIRTRAGSVEIGGTWRVMS